MQFDPNKMSWAHKWYDIPFIWNDLNNMGDNVTVAVIDTGVDTSHIDLNNNIVFEFSKNVFDQSPINDINGHGTCMAGIIGACGNKVFGVAPNAKLIIIKAALQARGADGKKYAEALNFVSNIPDVDIISFSNVFLKNDIELQNATQKCVSSNKIIVAGIGNNRNFMYPNGPDQDTFPACYDNVIAVGAFDIDGKISAFSNWNSHLCFLAPGENILTTAINNSTTIEKGTSIATAFTAGCLALMISYAKKNSVQPLKCVQALKDTCDDIGPVVGKDIQSGYGRINLRNAISKIKQI